MFIILSLVMSLWFSHFSMVERFKSVWWAEGPMENSCSWHYKHHNTPTFYSSYRCWIMAWFWDFYHRIMRQGIDAAWAKAIAGHPFFIWSVLDLRFWLVLEAFHHICSWIFQALIQVNYTTKTTVQWRCRSLLTRLHIILKEAVPKRCLTCHSLFPLER